MLLLLVMLLASLAEVVSIGAVVPFMGVLMAPERVFANHLAQPVIEFLGLTEPSQLLMPLTIAFIMAALVAGMMRLILLWAQTRLGFAVGADFSFRIYKNTLYQPYSVHVARNSSEVISAISTKTDTVINHCLLPLLFVASSSLIMCAILAALITINPDVAFSIFGGFGALYGLIVLVTKKSLVRDGRRISRESNQVIKALQEGLGGIREVLIDGTQAVYCKIYRDADLPMRKSQANIQIISSAPRFIIESFGMALIAVLAYGLTSDKGGAVNAIPILGALALGAQRLLPVLQLIYWSVSSIRGHEAALRDVLNLLDQPLPAYADQPPLESMRFNVSICLNKVSFRYREGIPWVLQGIDLEILKGARVGFIGTTGSGKSTLLDIVMGLLHPGKGVLAVDGCPVAAHNQQAWQSHISHVPQNIFLADSTIAENIAFGIPKEQIDYNRIKTAAQQACIDAVIESMPDKYNTFVGERGVRLSGGQRQRIGIARALYKRTEVIVFDEATSALDSETEQAIMDTIEHIGDEVTILMIAHRLSTLKNCDLIVELKQGTLSRKGSYAEIVQAERVF